jgi:hypothetical protein
MRTPASHDRRYSRDTTPSATRRTARGANRAVGTSILVSAYYMLTRDEPCSDLGADWLARRNTEAHTGSWSPDRRSSATRWGSTRPPEPAAITGRAGGLRPPALTRACIPPVHGSV